MFDIGWSEILLIAVVAIVVVGPKDLPPMLRAAGKMIAKLRKTAGEFQGQFNEALREAELDGVKDSLNELRGLNPMNQIRKTLDPMSAAIAKPAPPPMTPSMGQAPQLATDADLEPAKLPESVVPAPAAPEPVVAAKPKRAPRKPRTAEVDAALEEFAAVAKAPRVRKPATAKPVALDADFVPAKKPRAPRRKMAAVEPGSAPVEPAAVTIDPIPEERGS